jgi:hypothetical protein
MSIKNKLRFIDFSSIAVLALAVLVPLLIGIAAA